MYLWAIYIFPGFVCLFCFSQIGRQILRMYKLLTDSWMKQLGTRPRSFIYRNTWIGFSVQCAYRTIYRLRWTGTNISAREEISVFSYPYLSPYEFGRDKFRGAKIRINSQSFCKFLWRKGNGSQWVKNVGSGDFLKPMRIRITVLQIPYHHEPLVTTRKIINAYYFFPDPDTNGSYKCGRLEPNPVGQKWPTKRRNFKFWSAGSSLLRAEGKIWDLGSGIWIRILILICTETSVDPKHCYFLWKIL